MARAAFYFVADDGHDPIYFEEEHMLRKIARLALLVIHDPEVQRSGKQFAAKIAVRLALAAGGGTFYVELIHKYLG